MDSDKRNSFVREATFKSKEQSYNSHVHLSELCNIQLRANNQENLGSFQQLAVWSVSHSLEIMSQTIHHQSQSLHSSNIHCSPKQIMHFVHPVF